jgi:hypothetical protein
MADQSQLDLKYFIDHIVYNCPYCNRRNVKYDYVGKASFDWSIDKECWIWWVQCSSCKKTSMHLTFNDLQNPNTSYTRFRHNIDIDSAIFYSVPTSFFVIDKRIPKIIRELITEAEGCIKMNFLTGASACTRKAIYELTVKEKAEGENYEDRIKFLKSKFPDIDPDLFDVLCHIKDMTSEKVHEQSRDKWDSKHLKLFIETLKVILHEIYVVPDERKKQSESVRGILGDIKGKKQPVEDESKIK